MTVTTFVREEPATYTQHDQLFKELIHTFFAEFLEVFFPEVHDYIDFSSLQPLSEEVFTDLFEGETRRADIVIETKLKGENAVIIIHVEPQSYGQKNFHERMYHYFSLLYNKYRKPILPIAVFSYEENRNEKDQLTMEFPFFHVLTFNFLMLELRKEDWRNYIKSNNPVAAALLSKMGYTDKERIQVRIEFLRMLTKMELTPAKTRLILGFFERYLKLDEREEEELMEQIKNVDDSEEILNLPISWEEKGKEILPLKC
ncbi:Rpn family recombination-promoting nuclease/putative transposase [Virgibacillus ainsalahensis]